MTPSRRQVTFAPPGGLDQITFPWSDDKATLRVPTVGGIPVSASPPKAYDSPFLQSTVGERTVFASSGSGGLQLVYDFRDDSIRPAA